jgi:hypothetical protein
VHNVIAFSVKQQEKLDECLHIPDWRNVSRDIDALYHLEARNPLELSDDN